MDIAEQILGKYGQCFWNTILTGEDELKKYIGDDYIECSRWYEFDVTLIEISAIYDMHSEIVVLK